jgi:serine/threonine protein phosphatase PrpC
MAPLNWRSHAATTVGCVRKINEDACIERTEMGLWAVADGMGGHMAGDVASRTVVDALSTLLPADDLGDLIERVKTCLQEANLHLLEMAEKYGEGQIMGSTVVVLLAMGRHCAAVWLGDSRLYRYRDGVLSQLTRDHSLEAELSLMGVGEREGQSDNETGGILTRALGAEPDMEIDTITDEVREGDIYLLCSDGLIRELTDDEIEDLLSGTRFEESPQKLIDLALARGARDNVTVVVVRAGAPGPHR